MSFTDLWQWLIQWSVPVMGAMRVLLCIFHTFQHTLVY